MLAKIMACSLLLAICLTKRAALVEASYETGGPVSDFAVWWESGVIEPGTQFGALRWGKDEKSGVAVHTIQGKDAEVILKQGETRAEPLSEEYKFFTYYLYHVSARPHGSDTKIQLNQWIQRGFRPGDGEWKEIGSVVRKDNGDVPQGKIDHVKSFLEPINENTDNRDMDIKGAYFKNNSTERVWKKVKKYISSTPKDRDNYVFTGREMCQTWLSTNSINMFVGMDPGAQPWGYRFENEGQENTINFPEPFYLWGADPFMKLYDN